MRLIRNRRQNVSSLARLVAILSIMAGGAAWAQGPTAPGNRLKEPVYRISKAKVEPNVRVDEHPLDPAIARARDGLKNILDNVRDYTCTMIKRERIGDTLNDYEYMEAKIRSEQRINGRVVTPFSVYLKFLKPASIRGREVIYVRGRNEGKMIAHERPDSLLGKFGSVWLNPTGAMAMRGNRYPITEIGLETLIIRLLEKGVRDRKRGECDVKFHVGATINGRKCTMLQVTHPYPRPYFDFHIARIFIDDELNVPIRYAAYSWPLRPGGTPVLLEEYTYVKLKLNVGLTDQDFDPKNSDYNF